MLHIMYPMAESEHIPYIHTTEEGPVPKCLFNHAPPGELPTEAVGLFYLNEGCFAKDETFQPLCAQHVVSAAPKDGIGLVEIYNRDALEKTGWLDQAVISGLSTSEP